MKTFPSGISARGFARIRTRLQLRKSAIFTTLFAVLLSTFTFVSSYPAFADTAGSGACAQSFTKTGTGTVTVAEINGYCYVAFRNTGAINTQTSFSLTKPSNLTSLEYLVVAGGGGGALRHGGGGGAGGLLKGSLDVSGLSALSLTVGGGGGGATTVTSSPNNYGPGLTGQDSSIQSVVAKGGGGGNTGGSSSQTGLTGGSGGGALASNAGGAGTTGQGFAGAGGVGGVSPYSSGGGGGAGGAGTAGSGSVGGAGGTGAIWAASFTKAIAQNLGWSPTSGQFSGDQVFFAGGGGGGNAGGTGGTASAGGGAGSGTSGGVSGLADSGGGGGGSACCTDAAGGNGGSGVILIKYALQATVGDGQCVQNVSYGTGVSVIRSGNDCIVTFTSGSNNWTAPSSISSVRALVIGGGGAGGCGIGGGGGAGEYIEYSSLSVAGGTTYPLAVGVGGQPQACSSGLPGGNSTFSATTAYGGGGGAVNETIGPSRSLGTGTEANGSGGGAGYPNYLYTTATTSSANPRELFTVTKRTISGATVGAFDGGVGSRGGGPSATAGGGGGAGGAGVAGSAANAANQYGGSGGIGLSSNISGTSTFYAGGGGGGINGNPGNTCDCTSTGQPGAGGSGVGGAAGAKIATNPYPGSPNTIGNGSVGVANTGSGGGGGSNSSGGAGADGVVIIRYTLATQSALTITSTTGNLTENLALTTSGGSGSGAVSFAVTTAGTANCSVSGSTLSYTSIGSCTVTATKAGADGYASVSSSATTITIGTGLIAFESWDGGSVGVNYAGGTGNSGFSGNWLGVNSQNYSGLASTSPLTAASNVSASDMGRSFPAGVGFTLSSANTSIFFDQSGGGPHFRQLARALPSALSMDTNATYYLSFLSSEPYNDNQLMVGFMDGLPTSTTDTSKKSLLMGYVPSSGALGQYAIDYGTANRSAACPDDGVTACTSTPAYSSITAVSGGIAGRAVSNSLSYAHFVVAKVTAAASGNDTVQLKYFPLGAAIPTNDSSITWDLTRSAAITGSFSHLTTQMAGTGYSYLDEFRLGRTYMSVVNPTTTNVLTLNPNYVGGTTRTQTVSSGVDTVIAAPTRTGYVFTGWNTNADGISGTSYTATQPINIATDTTLYATWREFTVTFAAGTYGTGASQVFTKSYNVTYTMPDSAAANGYFTRPGYTIIGWGTSANGTAITNALGSANTNNYDQTFYPVWEGSQRNDYALNFTGLSGSYATPTATSIISTVGGAFTVEAWVKPSSTTINNTNAVIFSQGTGANRFYLKRDQLGNLRMMRPSAASETLCGNIPANFWNHVAVTYGGSGSTFCYVNGVLQNSTTGTGTINTKFVVGGFSDGLTTQDASWIGQIDEVRVHNTARSAAQLLTDAHTYGPVTDSSLIAHYDFNDGTGSTATNKKFGAAAGTDLTLNGSPVWTNLATTTTTAGVSRVTFERTYLNSYGGWDAPTGISSLKALIVGGGGGGGDSSSSYTGGSGGSGGYFATDSLVASGKLSVTVGAGGPGGYTTSAQGAAGGTSSIGTLKVGGGGGGNGYLYATVAAAGAGVGGADFVSSGSGGGGRSRNAGDNLAKTGGAAGAIAASGVTFQSNTYTGVAGAVGGDACACDLQSGGLGGAITAANRTSSISGTSVVYAKRGPFVAWEDGTNPDRPFTYGSGGSANYTYGVTEAASNFGGTGAPGVVILSWTSSSTVTFKSNFVGGSADTTQTISAGASAALTSNAFTRAGYRFDGWTQNADGTGTSYTDGQSVTPTGNIDLYAKWVFNAVPVFSYNASDIESYESTGTAVTDLSGNSVDGVGLRSLAYDTGTYAWTFAGGGISNTTGAYIDIEDITSTQFVNASGLTIDIEADFGSAADNYERILDLGVSGPNYGNVALGRSATSSDLELRLYQNQSTSSLRYRCISTAGITSGMHRWTVTIDGSSCRMFRDGTALTTSVTTSIAGLPATGMTWNVNWMGRSYFGGDAAFEGKIRSARLYAGAFTPTDIAAISYKTISYNSNGGSTAPSDVTTSGKLRLATPPTRNGFSFTGWWDASSGGTLVGASSAAYAPSASTTVYAQWSADTYTITFDSNGGSSHANGTFTGGGSGITLPTPTKAGYGFDGWFEDSGFAGSAVTTPYSPTRTRTLYAKWNANSNTVTYDSKGGSAVTSGSFTTGGSIASAPTAPTRAGYTLAGWSATDGGTVVTFPYSPSETSAITLYAKWNANSNTVTYDSKGGSAVADGSFTTGGSIASAPTVPTRAGYTLAGWSATDGGAVITFPYSPPETAAITLYAKWNANSNTVTYDSKGGSAVTSGSFLTGGSIASAPTAPTRDGYTFDGWSDTDGGTVITFPYSPTATTGITLYGVWTVIPCNPTSTSITGYTVYRFTSTGTCTWTVPGAPLTAEALVIAGGGGGGSAGDSAGAGGGGAGGFLESNNLALSSTVEITVGSGGAGGGSVYWGSGTNGKNSSIGSSLVAVGGGGGGGRGGAGQVGGSGGGAGGRFAVVTGAAGTAGQGSSGGTVSIAFSAGSGGGGAGGGGGQSSQPSAGTAGAGKSSSITGTAITYAAGGAGGVRTGTSSLTTSSGTAGTGGTGSSGGYTYSAANINSWGRGETGANGVVIVRLPASNTVTYDSKGGTSVSSGSFITGGSIASAPTAPTRSGYTFAGWSATDGGSAVTFPYAPGVATAITLYALWMGNSNTVTYDSKGGSAVADGTFRSGGSIASAPTSTRAGYTLAGWSDTDGGTVVTFPYSPGVITAITLYAKWTANTNTVTYDSKGGSAVTSGSFTTGGSIASAPTAPTRIGYTFDGWSATDGGSAITFPYTPGATSGITLYARWIEATYTVTYDVNGATGAPERSTDTYTYTGGALTLPRVASMSKTGYTFDGWAETSGGTKIAGTYTPASNKTLYARWVAVSYTITYIYTTATSGTPTATSGTFTTGGTAHSVTTMGSLARTGYTFAGWNTAEDMTGTNYAAGATLTTTANVNLYAKWTANSYSATYCEDTACNNPATLAGDVPVDALTYNIGNNVVVKANSGALARTGYTFAGWAINSDGSGTIYQSGDTYTVGSANVRFYPTWSANTYNITYNANGATGTPARTSDTYTTGGATISLPNVGSMTRTGYTFVGWSTSSTGSVLSGPYTTSSDVTLFAIWNIKTINYYYDRGTAGVTPVTNMETTTFPDTSAQSALFNSSITLSSTVDSTIAVGADNYKFYGWYDGNATYGVGSMFVIPDATKTFTAQWVKLYGVRYALNGGTGILARDTECLEAGYTCTPNQVITLSTAPTRNGYTFTGWKDQNNNPFAAGTSFTVTDSSYLLYAQWTAIDYTIAYTPVGGSASPASETKHIGDVITLPSPGTKAGYDFNGWIAGSTTYGAGTNFTVGASSVTFVASWTPHRYTVSYNWNGGLGAAESPVVYTVGTAGITLPGGSGHSRDGYVFDGWAETDGGTKLAATYIPTGDKLLFARWIDGAYTITYDTVGGTLGSPTASVTRSTAFTLPTPTRTGFVFDGWYADAANTIVYGSAGASITPTSSKTIYAKWTQKSLAGINPAHLNSLATIVAQASTDNGWTGSHSLSGTGAALNIPAGALPQGTVVQVSFVEDLTRPASLIENNNAYFTSVVVHWLSGAGPSATVPVASSPLTMTLTNPAIVAGAKVFKIVNGVVTEVATATVDGSVQIVFTEDPEFVVAATRPGTPTSVTATNAENSRSTVSWTAPAGNGGSAITGYTVTATPGGATCTSATTTCAVTGLTNNTSYTFTVAARNAIGTSATSAASSAIIPRATPIYNLTFNSNGGSAVSATSFLQGSSITAPANPTRSGYSFVGWSVSNGGSAITFPYTPSNADLTLYAIWEANPTPATTTSPKPGSTKKATSAPASTKKASASPTASASASPSATATSKATGKPSAAPTPNNLFADAPKPGKGITKPDAGAAATVVGADEVKTVITSSEFDNKVEVGDSIAVTFSSLGEDGKPLPTSPSGTVEVVRGTSVSAAGEGFKPGSPVEVWIHSDPVLLGTGVADETGKLDETFDLTADVPLGDHTIVLHGVTPEDEIVTVALGVSVVAPVDVPTVAAEDGSNLLVSVMAAFLLALIAGLLWFIVRRRTGAAKK